MFRADSFALAGGNTNDNGPTPEQVKLAIEQAIEGTGQREPRLLQELLAARELLPTDPAGAQRLLEDVLHADMLLGIAATAGATFSNGASLELGPAPLQRAANVSTGTTGGLLPPQPDQGRERERERDWRELLCDLLLLDVSSSRADLGRLQKQLSATVRQAQQEPLARITVVPLELQRLLSTSTSAHQLQAELRSFLLEFAQPRFYVCAACASRRLVRRNPEPLPQRFCCGHPACVFLGRPCKPGGWDELDDWEVLFPPPLLDAAVAASRGASAPATSLPAAAAAMADGARGGAQGGPQRPDMPSRAAGQAAGPLPLGWAAVALGRTQLQPQPRVAPVTMMNGSPPGLLAGSLDTDVAMEDLGQTGTCAGLIPAKRPAPAATAAGRQAQQPPSKRGTQSSGAGTAGAEGSPVDDDDGPYTGPPPAVVRRSNGAAAPAFTEPKLTPPDGAPGAPPFPLRVVRASQPLSHAALEALFAAGPAGGASLAEAGLLAPEVLRHAGLGQAVRHATGPRASSGAGSGALVSVGALRETELAALVPLGLELGEDPLASLRKLLLQQQQQSTSLGAGPAAEADQQERPGLQAAAVGGAGGGCGAAGGHGSGSGARHPAGEAAALGHRGGGEPLPPLPPLDVGELQLNVAGLVGVRSQVSLSAAVPAAKAGSSSAAPGTAAAARGGRSHTDAASQPRSRTAQQMQQQEHQQWKPQQLQQQQLAAKVDQQGQPMQQAQLDDLQLGPGAGFERWQQQQLELQAQQQAVLQAQLELQRQVEAHAKLRPKLNSAAQQQQQQQQLEEKQLHLLRLQQELLATQQQGAAAPAATPLRLQQPPPPQRLQTQPRQRQHQGEQCLLSLACGQSAFAFGPPSDGDGIAEEEGPASALAAAFAAAGWGRRQSEVDGVRDGRRAPAATPSASLKALAALARDLNVPLSPLPGADGAVRPLEPQLQRQRRSEGGDVPRRLSGGEDGRVLELMAILQKQQTLEQQAHAAQKREQQRAQLEREQQREQLGRQQMEREETMALLALMASGSGNLPPKAQERLLQLLQKQQEQEEVQLLHLRHLQAQKGQEAPAEVEGALQRRQDARQLPQQLPPPQRRGRGPPAQVTAAAAAVLDNAQQALASVPLSATTATAAPLGHSASSSLEASPAPQLPGQLSAPTQPATHDPAAELPSRVSGPSLAVLDLQPPAMLPPTVSTRSVGSAAPPLPLLVGRLSAPSLAAVRDPANARLAYSVLPLRMSAPQAGRADAVPQGLGAWGSAPTVTLAGDKRPADDAAAVLPLAKVISAPAVALAGGGGPGGGGAPALAGGAKRVVRTADGRVFLAEPLGVGVVGLGRGGVANFAAAAGGAAAAAAAGSPPQQGTARRPAGAPGVPSQGVGPLARALAAPDGPGQGGSQGSAGGTSSGGDSGGGGAAARRAAAPVGADRGARAPGAASEASLGAAASAAAAAARRPANGAAAAAAAAAGPRAVVVKQQAWPKGEPRTEGNGAAGPTPPAAPGVGPLAAGREGERGGARQAERRSVSTHVAAPPRLGFGGLTLGAAVARVKELAALAMEGAATAAATASATARAGGEDGGRRQGQGRAGEEADAPTAQVTEERRPAPCPAPRPQQQQQPAAPPEPLPPQATGRPQQGTTRQGQPQGLPQPQAQQEREEQPHQPGQAQFGPGTSQGPQLTAPLPGEPPGPGASVDRVGGSEARPRASGSSPGRSPESAAGLPQPKLPPASSSAPPAAPPSAQPEAQPPVRPPVPPPAQQPPAPLREAPPALPPALPPAQQLPVQLREAPPALPPAQQPPVQLQEAPPALPPALPPAQQPPVQPSAETSPTSLAQRQAMPPGPLPPLPPPAPPPAPPLAPVPAPIPASPPPSPPPALPPAPLRASPQEAPPEPGAPGSAAAAGEASGSAQAHDGVAEQEPEQEPTGPTGAPAATSAAPGPELTPQPALPSVAQQASEDPMEWEPQAGVAAGAAVVAEAAGSAQGVWPQDSPPPHHSCAAAVTSVS